MTEAEMRAVGEGHIPELTDFGFGISPWGTQVFEEERATLFLPARLA